VSTVSKFAEGKNRTWLNPEKSSNYLYGVFIKLSVN
jgi:hypothetical protein